MSTGYDWRRDVYGPAGLPYKRSGGSSFDWSRHFGLQDDELKLKNEDNKPLWKVLEEAGAAEQVVQLEKGRDRYTTAYQTATGLGTPDDGAAPPGMLERFFRVADAPRAGMMAFGTLATGQGWDEAKRRFGERESLTKLAGEQDLEGWKKWGALGAGFAMDVAMDPITYLSGGQSVMGRAVAGKGVAALAKRNADDVVQAVAKSQGDDAVRKLASELPTRELRTFVEARGGGNLAKATREELLDTAQKQGWLNDLAQRGFESGVWERYAAEGSTVLRQWLDEFGDAGRKFFDSMPVDTQGGLRMRVPFARETSSTGVRTPIAFKVPGTGGGRALEAMGLGGLTTVSNQTRHVLRNWGPTGWLSKHASGELGGLRQSVLKNVYGGIDMEDGIRGSDYLRVVSQRAEMNLRDVALDKSLFARGSEVDWILNEGAERAGLNKAAVNDAYQRFYARRDLARQAANQLDSLTPEEQSGLLAAQQLHTLLDEVADAATQVYGSPQAARQALEEYSGIGEGFAKLDNYTPRIRTDMEEARQLTSTGKAGKNPLKHREMYKAIPEVEVGPDGVERLRLQRWMTAEEITEASGREVFIEDPMTAVVEYLGIMRSKLRQESMFRTMQASGLGVDAGQAGGRSVNETNAWRLVGEALDDSGDLVRQIQEAPDAAALRRILGESFDLDAEARKVIPESRIPWRKEVAADEFHEAIRRAQQQTRTETLPDGTVRQRTLGETVFGYAPEEYAGMRLFLSEDGRTGFALRPSEEGLEFVSAFNYGAKGRGDDLVAKAAREGATFGDAFDEGGFLPDLYRRFGFDETGRQPWDPKQAPEGWKGDAPDVVSMRFNPERILDEGGPTLRAQPGKPGKPVAMSVDDLVERASDAGSQANWLEANAANNQQVERWRDVIRRGYQLEPLQIAEDGSIHDGFHRLAAARAEGLTEVPTVQAPRKAGAAAPAPARVPVEPGPSSPLPAKQAAGQAPAAALPDGLAGAKPKYNYGQKAFDLTFESDTDRAIYIVTTAKGDIRSKAHAKYLSWLHEQGLGNPAIRERGVELRTGIKAQAKAAEPGRLTVPGPAKPKAAPPTVTPRRPAKFGSVEEIDAYLTASGDSELGSTWWAVVDNVEQLSREEAVFRNIPLTVKKWTKTQAGRYVARNDQGDALYYVRQVAKGDYEDAASVGQWEIFDAAGEWVQNVPTLKKAKSSLAGFEPRKEAADSMRASIREGLKEQWEHTFDPDAARRQGVAQLNSLLDSGEVMPMTDGYGRIVGQADELAEWAGQIPQAQAVRATQPGPQPAPAPVPRKPPAPELPPAKRPATKPPIEVIREQQLRQLANDRARLAQALDPANLPDNPDDIDAYFQTMTRIVGKYRAKRPQDVAGNAAEYKRWARQNGVVELIGDGRADQLRPTAAARLENLFGPEAVADMMVDMYHRAADPTQFRKFVDDYYKPFFTAQKFLMTVNRGPGYVSRNVAGGMWTGYLAGVRPGHWRKSGKVNVAYIKAKHAARQAGGSPEAKAQVAQETFEKAVRQGFGEEADQVLQAWDLFHRHDLGGLGVGSKMRGSIETWTKSGRSQMTDEMARQGYTVGKDGNLVQRGSQATINNPWAKHVMVPMASSSEDYLRFGAFLRGVDLYGLDDGGYAAGLLVKGTQWDYGDLSRTEANLLKNVVPFYTWSRYAIPMQFRAMVFEPGRVSKALRFQDTLREGFEEDADKLEALPGWVRRNLGFQTKARTKDGAPITLGLFWGEPLLDINRLFRDPFSSQGLAGKRGFINTDEVRNNMNPFAKATAELYTGRDAFTGQSLDIDREAPRWARYVPGLTYETPDGERMGRNRAVRSVETVLPPLGQLARLFPEVLGNERLEARKGTSWAAQMTAAPVSTMDPWQLRNEMYQRTEQIDKGLERQHPNLDDRSRMVRALLEAGYSPEEVAQMGVADMPEQLLDPREVMSVDRAEADWASQLPDEQRKAFRAQQRSEQARQGLVERGASPEEADMAAWLMGARGAWGAPESPFAGQEGAALSGGLNEWLASQGQPTQLQHFVTPARRAWDEYLNMFEPESRAVLRERYDELRKQGYPDDQIIRALMAR